jgi:aminopeptidase N
MRTETPHPILLRDYRPPAFLIDTVALEFDLKPDLTHVRNRMRLRPNPACGEPETTLRLDGEHIQLLELKLDGRVLPSGDYRVGPTDLTIRHVPKGAFTIEVVTTCRPESNKALQGLYRSRAIYCTQCEAQGFRRITYYLDRPDILARFTTRIVCDADAARVLLSNGNLVERGPIDGGRRHFAIWQDPHPKPSYLFALVAGNLERVTSHIKTRAGRNVELNIYVEAGKETRCDWAMDSLKRSIIWDEENWGRAYDLDVFNIVAVSDFNMGAMENKGLNIFNDRLVLASVDTATDADYANIERVIAHEYFHNWTGNRITCRDWFQLCLKEGLTVYRDQEFSGDQRDHAVQRIQDVRILKARQFPEDAGPLAHPVRPDRYIEINNFYTATVYEKGAELVRMIATLLGRGVFRKGMDLYFKRHDGEAATVEQFIACFEAAGKRDLSQFMTWYEQAGTPELVVSFSHNAKANSATLVFEQVLKPTPGDARKSTLHIPVRLGLIGHDGKEANLVLDDGTRLDNGILELTKRKQRVTFANLKGPVVPSLLRGFSAPVILTMNLTEDDLAFLAARDSDPFNRWQAAQDYATRLMLSALRRSERDGAERRRVAPGPYIDALRMVLDAKDLAPAFKAQMLTLPPESDIARILGVNVDPSAIHRARSALRRRIATALGEQLVSLYSRHESKRRFSADATASGKRALRNSALALLALRGSSDDLRRVARHFDTAENATDTIAALSVLADTNSPERRRAFATYHDRWKDDHIAIDQWFSLQAASSLASSLAAAKKLVTHPLFSLQNPNKVRAVIGTFATANAVNFNRPDGAGYAFVADHALMIDAFNPQVAARLLGTFRSWRTLEPVRQAAAGRVLRGVAQRKTLSRDSYEIVSKMLE